MNLNHHFGKMICVARKRKKLTQVELAKIAGFRAPQIVYLIEKGKVKIPHPRFKKIIQHLGLDRERIIKLKVKHYIKKLRQEL